MRDPNVIAFDATPYTVGKRWGEEAARCSREGVSFYGAEPEQETELVYAAFAESLCCSMGVIPTLHRRFDDDYADPLDVEADFMCGFEHGYESA